MPTTKYIDIYRHPEMDGTPAGWVWEDRNNEHDSDTLCDGDKSEAQAWKLAVDGWSNDPDTIVTLIECPYLDDLKADPSSGLVEGWHRELQAEQPTGVNATDCDHVCNQCEGTGKADGIVGDPGDCEECAGTGISGYCTKRSWDAQHVCGDV